MASIAEDLRKTTPIHTKQDIEYLATAFWNLLKTVSQKMAGVKEPFNKKPTMVVMLAFVREALRMYTDAQHKLQSKLIILCM